MTSFLQLARLSIEENLITGALIAIMLLCSSIHTEWKLQPRKLTYWHDETPAGLVIRHLRSGEVLFRTACEVLEPEELRGLNLNEADLGQEQLIGLDLRGMQLRGANLEEASLYDCCFDGADLSGCRMAGAWLKGASFKGADLRGVDFRGRSPIRGLARRMEGANFFGARYNAATRWPPGFDPAEHGCAYENDAEHDFPIPTAGGVDEAGSLPVVAQVSPAEAPVSQTEALIVR